MTNMEKFPINGILNLLEKENNFVFLENARLDAQNYLSYLFIRPERIISTSKINQVKDCFIELNRALKKGCYLAGFLSYEAGEAFEERLKSKQAYDFPLLWFGIYREPLIYNHRKGAFAGCSQKNKAFIKKIALSKIYTQKSFLLKNIRPNISPSSYTRAITKIRSLIAQGSTYQVNYTFKLKFSFSGSPVGLYFSLRNNQAVSYSALIKTKPLTTSGKGRGAFSVVSFSPELFFRKRGGKICARPMKGTIKRGKDLKEDADNIRQLENCLKNRSENVMIVDLLRSDLGRISSTGSVKVPRLFRVERYQTLFQMTSDIESRLKHSDLSFDIFSHIFPSGSVTGAPKVKTMQIIRALEKEPRRVYTGSIGFFSPEKTGTFNVAIRTLLINTQPGTGEMGVGSGIVYDSDPKNEYDECRLKANFLTKRAQDFALIETMLWQPNSGYAHLNLHLKRLENSAGYFDFLYKKKDILKALMKLQHTFESSAYKVRLLLSKDASLQLIPSPLVSLRDRRPKAYLSTKKTDSQNVFLYHKTTNRKIYSDEYRRARRLGYCDVIFANEKGEITEGAISNIFIRKKATLYTPPITCGLLDGVYRRYLLGSKKYTIKEKVLFTQDLEDAEEIYLSNSVRGLFKVHLV